MRCRCALLFIVLVIPASLFADGADTMPASTAPTTLPTAAATTESAPPRRIEPPPGFHRLDAAGRVAICLPADDARLQTLLAAVAPTTRPSTMPADVLARLNDRRPLLKQHLAADLALKNVDAVDVLIDKTLIPQVQRLADLKPNIVYFFATRERLRDALKAGWSNPRFHYNRIADEVQFDPSVRMPDDRPIDDLLIPAIYPADTPADSVQSQFAQLVSRTESDITLAVSQRAQIVTQLSLIDFIQLNAIDPLKLKTDQMWLGLGLEAILSARYLHELLDVSPAAVMQRLTSDNPRNPIRADSIDLLHPADLSQMRPDWIAAYEESFRIKSARVVQNWINQCGDSAIANTLSAIRLSPPADGPALVKLINVTTGDDLTSQLQPR